MADLEVLAIEDCWAKHETAAAILVQMPDDTEQWIPKSQIDYDRTEVYDSEENCRGTLVVSKWIGEQKGITDLGTLHYVGP